MESETLFKEEEEPPGPLTGLVNVENKVSDFFLFNIGTLFIIHRLNKSQIEFYFLLKIQPVPVFSGHDIIPTLPAWNGLIGIGNFVTPSEK